MCARASVAMSGSSSAAPTMSCAAAHNIIFARNPGDDGWAGDASPVTQPSEHSEVEADHQPLQNDGRDDGSHRSGDDEPKSEAEQEASDHEPQIPVSVIAFDTAFVEHKALQRTWCIFKSEMITIGGKQFAIVGHNSIGFVKFVSGGKQWGHKKTDGYDHR